MKVIIDTSIVVSAAITDKNSEADFLITGDTDFNEAQTLLNTTIISLYLFKRLVCDVRE